MPLPSRLSVRDLHVGVAAGARRVVASGIRSHHVTIADAERTTRLGADVTTIERTWCDLAAGGLTLSELVAAGDYAIWRRRPLTSRASLEKAFTGYAGRRGTRRLGSALQLLSERSDSAPESELRVWVIEAGLPAPSVNVAVFDKRGRFLAQPDLTWRDKRLALEYEGDHHRTDPKQWHADLERFARLQEHGWTVLRAAAEDYRRPGRLLARLARILISPGLEST
jgi:hypothetical protein